MPSEDYSGRPPGRESAEVVVGRPPYWMAFGAVIVGFAAGTFLALIVQLIGSTSGHGSASATPAANIVADFVFDGAFVGAALYFTLVSGWGRRIRFGYTRIRWRTGIGAVLAAGLAYYVITLGYAAVFNLHGTDKLPSGLGLHSSAWAAGGVALFVCAAAPMAEEFFFRGFLFGILRRMRVRVGGRELGPWAGAAIVGIIFGLAHFDSAQPEYLIPLGFLGFLLCVVRWKTGSLYPGMALHSINNCIALGVDEMGWNTGEIVALTVGALLLIAVVTGPLSRRSGAAVAGV